MTRARKPTRARVTTLVIELELNRARFGNHARIKSSLRPTELNNICSRATELDIDFSGRGRGEGEVQIMLDIGVSRGRDNIKNYGEEKNSKKYLVFPVSELAMTLIPAVCLVWEGKRNKVGGGGERGWWRRVEGRGV